MTREKAKVLLPIIQAIIDGREIQVNLNGEWVDVDEKHNCAFLPESYEYRVKPMITYRPFKDGDECWNEMFRHQPFGWINKMEKGQIKGRYSIEIVREDGVVLRLENGSTMHFDFKDLIDSSYCFSDGTPFGIKELV